MKIKKAKLISTEFGKDTVIALFLFEIFSFNYFNDLAYSSIMKVSIFFNFPPMGIIKKAFQCPFGEFR
jgi:hypothetical protein